MSTNVSSIVAIVALASGALADEGISQIRAGFAVGF